MRRALDPLRRQLALLVCVLLTGAAVVARAQQVRPLSFTRFTLPNGMKLYLLEDHELPVVNGTALREYLPAWLGQKARSFRKLRPITAA